MSEMKLLILLLAIQNVCSTTPFQSSGEVYQALNDQAQGQQQYDFGLQQQKGHHQTFQHQGFNQGHQSSIQSSPENAHSNFGNAKILNYQHNTDEHKNYQYAFETDNGINVQEIGYNSEQGTKMQGAYSYTGDDGKVYTVTYTADENGFHPSGAHLPTPPPMPEEIAKSVELNLQAEANGIIDDGQYHEQYQHEQYSQQSELKPQISSPTAKNRQQLIHKHQRSKQALHVQQQKQTLAITQRPQHVSFTDKEVKRTQGHRSAVEQLQNLPLKKVPTAEVFQSSSQNNHQQPNPQNTQNPGNLKDTHTPLASFMKTRPSLKQVHKPVRGQQNYHNMKQYQYQAEQQQQMQPLQQPNHQQPEIEQQHIIEYILPTVQKALNHEPHNIEYVPANQNVITQENHKVEYHVPSMKHLGLQLQQLQPQNHQVLYQVPSVNQHKLAEDYIGPAPVAENHYQ